MVKFNLITQGFVSNLTVSNQRILNAEEFATLSSGIASITVASGLTVGLLIDLGAQKSTDRLEYAFSPVTLSGLSASYGRDLNTLTNGVLNLTSSGITVLPTISGYTYPRYFIITHTAPTNLTLNALSVLNNDSEIGFGDYGLTDSVTITSSGIGGVSLVQEIKVVNSGTIPTDMYVSIDPNIDPTVFSNISIAPTSTGIFQSINSDLTMPDSIPWEFGNLNNVSIVSNTLKLKDNTFTFPTFSLGQSITLNTISTNNYRSSTLYPAQLNDGTYVMCTTDTANRILLIDPIKNITYTSSYPTVTPPSSQEMANQSMAWDGNDRIYYMNNSTDSTIRYYKISDNTHNVLTTVSFYTRDAREVLVYNGYLYVAGGLSSAGTNASRGNQFWKIDLTSLVSTRLADLPSTAQESQKLTVCNGIIYWVTYYNNKVFAKYNLQTDMWGSLPLATGTFWKGMSAHVSTNEIYIFDTDRVHPFNTITSLFGSDICISYNTGITVEAACILAQESLIGAVGTSSAKAYVIGAVPAPPISITASGTYLSPIFKLDNTINYHNLLLEYVKNSSAAIKFDDSIGVDNFQIRGSSSSPAYHNSIQKFDTALSSDIFYTGALSQSSIDSGHDGLVFTHDYIDPTNTPNNDAYVYYSFPFNTTGNMQYKFNWNPTSAKTVGSSNYSAFYLVPFLDAVGEGKLAARDANLRRNVDDNIYIRFGQNSDSGGTFTRLSFYNGSTTTNYSISATTGTYYQVILLINWDSGDYKLYFDGSLLGTGTIPQNRLNLLRPQHSWEIYSGSQGIDCQEKIKFLTINRAGLTSSSTSSVAIPVHMEDPLYGANGALPWFPISINAPLIPKYDYVQFKLTLRSNGTYDKPTVNGVTYPVVLVLKDVPPGDHGSIYLQYNFPASNNLATNVAYLKTWMYTDKT